MYVSQETPQQTQERLLRVMREAQLVVYDKPHAFVEASAAHFPAELIPDALAFVRDEDVWSALVPAWAPEQEQFVLFSFHFPHGMDNSGFVGWLASHLKAKTGSGVMVVCGQNSLRGGIFDYWGAPIGVAKQVLAELELLRSSAV
ncbi:DUF6196 family protein [Pseudoduganella sp. RAF53_2]|uniref:DUF6196 family protein n=1 Tax=unclassified Pseudoduganella TaxID=2637179 RepID=UPI003F9B2F2D